MNEKNRKEMTREKRSASVKRAHERRIQKAKDQEELHNNLEVFMKASNPDFEKKVEDHLREERKRFVKAEAQKYFQKQIVENTNG